MMSASSLSPDPPVDLSLVRGAVGVGLDLRLLDGNVCETVIGCDHRDNSRGRRDHVQRTS